MKNDMQNEFPVGQQFLDTLVGDIVTVVATEKWLGGLAVCVRNPATPNPANIPGLENYWTDSRHLQPLED